MTLKKKTNVTEETQIIRMQLTTTFMKNPQHRIEIKRAIIYLTVILIAAIAVI